MSTSGLRSGEKETYLNDLRVSKEYCYQPAGSPLLILTRSRRTAPAPKYADSQKEAEVVPSSAVGKRVDADAVVEQMAN